VWKFPGKGGEQESGDLVNQTFFSESLVYEIRRAVFLLLCFYLLEG
jgi:hypothetical protein